MERQPRTQRRTRRVSETRVIKNFSKEEVAHALTEHILRRHVIKEGAFNTMTLLKVHFEPGATKAVHSFRVEIQIGR